MKSPTLQILLPRKNKLPHKNALTRLRPSKVHRGGVGVFAICNIKQNSPIFGDDDDNTVDYSAYSESPKANRYKVKTNTPAA
jgi:hypothetical protein